MADLPRWPDFDIKRVEDALNPFKVVNHFYAEEIEALIKLMLDASLGESIRHAIRKYLTVTIFAALDFYFRNCARNLVDKNILCTDCLFPAKSKSRLDKLLREKIPRSGLLLPQPTGS